MRDTIPPSNTKESGVQKNSVNNEEHKIEESKSTQPTSTQIKSNMKEQVSKKNNDNFLLANPARRHQKSHLQKINKPTGTRSKISRFKDQDRLEVVDRLDTELNEQMDIRLLRSKHRLKTAKRLLKLTDHIRRMPFTTPKSSSTTKALEQGQQLDDDKRQLLSLNKSIHAVIPNVSQSIDSENTTAKDSLTPILKRLLSLLPVVKNKPTKIPSLALEKEPESISQARYSRMFSSSFQHCPKIIQPPRNDATHASLVKPIEHVKRLAADTLPEIEKEGTSPFLFFTSLKSLPFSKDARKKFNKEQEIKLNQRDH